METLEYIYNKYNLDRNADKVEIPESGRVEMASFFNELGFKVGAEIGVLGGDYSIELCKAIPDLHFYGIDPWLVFSRNYWRTQGEMDNWKYKAKEQLKPYNVTFIERWSMDAVKDFKDESLDFVYIDGNHTFDFVVNDIIEWTKKVRPGGIVSGHDYYESKLIHSKMQVKYAVDAYTEANRLKLFIWDKKNDQKRDARRSWMFVRPNEP